MPSMFYELNLGGIFNIFFFPFFPRKFWGLFSDFLGELKFFNL